MDNFKLSPPWVTFANEIKAMFKKDPSVRVIFDQQAMEIKLYVESTTKAEALEQLLVKEAEFGGVTVKVVVIPGNAVTDKYVNIYATAFESNPALLDTMYVQNPLGNFTYVIWSVHPVQFFDDNLGDFQGKKTMLMEDIARDVMAEKPLTFHCSEEAYEGFTTGAAPEQWP